MGTTSSFHICPVLGGQCNYPSQLAAADCELIKPSVAAAAVVAVWVVHLMCLAGLFNKTSTVITCRFSMLYEKNVLLSESLNRKKLQLSIAII